MNGHRAKKLRKLVRGATVAGAYLAAKRWWEWLSPRNRGHVTALVSAGGLDTLGAGWRTNFVTPTPGAAPPARKPRRRRPSGAEKRRLKTTYVSVLNAFAEAIRSLPPVPIPAVADIPNGPRYRRRDR